MAQIRRTGGIILGNGGGRFKITATGGDVSGNGGSIKLASNVVSWFLTVEFRNSEDAIDVSAPGDSGNGGQVQVLSASPTLFHQNQDKDNTSQPVKTVINASGGFLSGNGGFIEIPNGEATATRPLNVNSLMYVDGGTTEPSGAMYGRIKLNGVDCVQTKTPTAPAWPATLWSCNGASGASSAMLAAANSLNQPLKDELGSLASLTEENPNVQIYGFPDEGRMITFFKTTTTSTAPAGGLSIERIRVSGVFDTAVQLGGTTAEAAGQHELGHQFEYIWGDAAINDTAFLNAYSTDVNAFNALPCTTAFPPGKQQFCNDPGNNIDRLVQHGRRFDVLKEAFADIFEHVSQPYQIDPDFPVIFDHFSQMISVMQMRIANPPAPQQ